MKPITINKNEVLILKTDLLLHPRDVEKIRNDIINQINSGAVIIPNGFSYTIRKRNHLEQKGIERLIDANNLNFEGLKFNKSQMKAILDFIDKQPTIHNAKNDAIDTMIYAVKAKEQIQKEGEQ